MNSGFNGVNSIKGSFWEIHLHEITLDEFQLLFQVELLSVVVGLLDLVIVVVQTGDMSTSESGNFSSWATNTTTDIKDLPAFFDTNLAG
ncbi:hypothetical protein WICPIJ_006607 [Wickerhamomyces pijperi]|uniref:Uncharacterized protein n=1 Tax=Wickerhamomyces pijperi TaxID=599730 RepID=A0A9P8Q1Q8_WICPI|nr:hypothetical protein WICPIJ_006607 [Wickerhamomyces pijperi]